MSIDIQNLSFSYSASAPVLSDISFSAGDGKLLSVLGPNGVGKTTLFRCIFGLLPHYQGTILIDGADAASLSPKEMAHRIAHVPQIHGMAFSFSVMDMVLMGTAHTLSALSHPGRKECQTAQKAMEQLGILHLADRSFSELSGGEQQLVLIARALAQETHTIILDEPTASLDYGNQTLVLTQARALADQGYTVILSTHNPQHALWFADTALALHQGKVAAFGSPQSVLTPELIRTLYGVSTEFIHTPQGTLISPVIERR